jgi:hypothetical protein
MTCDFRCIVLAGCGVNQAITSGQKVRTNITLSRLHSPSAHPRAQAAYPAMRRRSVFGARFAPSRPRGEFDLAGGDPSERAVRAKGDDEDADKGEGRRAAHRAI